MILSDNELKDLVAKMEISFDDHNHEFHDIQVQPASIDLRVDHVFWRFKKAGVLSLNPNDPPPSRQLLWEKVVLAYGDYIELKPGEMLLARTLERFFMPYDHAGLLEGRSSYARLGLQITVSGGFVNPGFIGHKAMQIINHNPMKIRLYPFIPMCQLIIWRLTSQSALPYDSRERNSKYLHGEAGPSYWWKDDLFSKLREGMSNVSIHADVQERILHLVGENNPKVLLRLNGFIRNLRVEEATSAEYIVKAFMRREERRKTAHRVRVNLVRIAFALSIGNVFRHFYLESTFLPVLITSVVLTTVFGIWTIRDWFVDEPKFFTEADLED